MGNPDAGTGEAARPERLCVTVIYAVPEEQHVVSLVLPAGCSVAEAVRRSGLLQRFPGIAGRPLQCAIFNRVVGNAEVLREGDRVEILRPLQVDPKEQRRREAARARGKR
jgi:putative ubiquitin-RnfH superfamily antitoxin RatB of RatAB toxin-antitoxin module